MKHFKRPLITSLLIGFFCCLELPVMAQAIFLTPAQQKKDVKKSLREAKKVKSDYQETHLNVSAYNFEIGESGRKRVRNLQDHDDQLMDKDGKAISKKNQKPKKPKASKKKKRS